MPAEASSARRHSLNIRTAAFVAAYAGSEADGEYAAAEAMFTRWPPVPRSAIWVPNSRQPRTTPSRLTPTIRCQSSSVCASNGPTIAIPALLTTTSGTPTSVRTQSAKRSMSAAADTSTCRACAVPPRAAISSQTDVAAARSRSATTILAPLAANPSAIARPMPLPAPVTTTSLFPNVFSASLMGLSVCSTAR